MNFEPASPDSSAPDEASLLRQVEHELRSREDSTITLKTCWGAFGFALLACLGVFALALAHSRPVEVARPIPRWVPWTYSFEEAQARATRNHQKIFIDFYTDWCPACREMDSVVYTRQEVLEQSQNVVMAKINAEGRVDLAKRYNIRVFPSQVWADASGTEVARHDGGAGAPTLASLMAQNR